MNKIISLPILLLVLNFNAQKDFIIKYDLKTFASNNYELIENFNPKKNNERIKFNKILSQHIKKNNGNKAYFSEFPQEFALDLKNNPNYQSYLIKFRNRFIISLGIAITGVIVLGAIASTDPYGAIFAMIFILPSTAVLSLIPFIGISKIKAQLHKDYFLSISSANIN